MALQNFDELNSMSTKWYSVMEIPEKDKKKRVDLSLEFCEIMIMLFGMLMEQEMDRLRYIAFLEERLRIIAEKKVGKEGVAYINDWSAKKAEQIVDTTIENRDKALKVVDVPEIEEQPLGEEKKKDTIDFPEFGVEIPTEEYWTSDFRALLLSIQLSSTVANFQELSDALDAGKTRKVWVTEADDRVRKTHQAVHGTDIPINEYFLVGNSYMLMPGDDVNGAEEKEISNCRCHLEYY